MSLQFFLQTNQHIFSSLKKFFLILQQLFYVSCRDSFYPVRVQKFHELIQIRSLLSQFKNKLAKWFNINKSYLRIVRMNRGCSNKFRNTHSRFSRLTLQNLLLFLTHTYQNIGFSRHNYSLLSFPRIEKLLGSAATAYPQHETKTCLCQTKRALTHVLFSGCHQPPKPVTLGTGNKPRRARWKGKYKSDIPLLYIHFLHLASEYPPQAGRRALAGYSTGDATLRHILLKQHNHHKRR